MRKTQSRNKSLMLDKITKRNASKFANFSYSKIWLISKRFISSSINILFLKSEKRISSLQDRRSCNLTKFYFWGVVFCKNILFLWILVLLIEFTIVQLPSFAKCTRTWWQYLMGSFCIKSHAMIEFLTGISNPGILRKKVTVWKSNFRFACLLFSPSQLRRTKMKPISIFLLSSSGIFKKSNFTLLNLKR